LFGGSRVQRRSAANLTVHRAMASQLSQRAMTLGAEQMVAQRDVLLIY